MRNNYQKDFKEIFDRILFTKKFLCAPSILNSRLDFEILFKLIAHLLQKKMPFFINAKSLTKHINKVCSKFESQKQYSQGPGRP